MPGQVISWTGHGDLTLYEIRVCQYEHAAFARRAEQSRAEQSSPTQRPSLAQPSVKATKGVTPI